MRTWQRTTITLLVTVSMICALLATPLGGVFPVSRANTALSLTKGSWDIIGLDSNKPGPPNNEGPCQFLIQIHVTNTGTEPASGITASFAWTTTNTYVNLATGEPLTKVPDGDPTTSAVDPLAPGTTVDVFYMVEVTRTKSAYSTARDYTISVTGVNFPAQSISGHLLVERLVSQNRNSVLSVTPSTLTPAIGEIFTVDVDSDTSTTYDQITTPVIGYDPSKVQPIAVVTSYGATTNTNILQTNAGGTIFHCHWTLRAIAVGATFLGPYIYDHSGSSYHYNADYGQDRSTIDVTALADLSVTKTVDNAAPYVGNTVTYTITAANDGPSDATGVTVTDTLPAGLTFVSATPSVGTWAASTWTIGSLANGGSATLTITARVNGSAVPEMPLQNTATIGGAEADPHMADNTATVSITPHAVTDLALTKTAPAGPYDLGTNVTFTLTATNDGPSTATGVTVTDTLPAGLTFVSATPSVGTWAASTWTIGSLANGGSATLTITAQVTATGSFTNTAAISGSEIDPDSSNNTASSTVSGTAADLAVTKTVTPGTAYVGDTVHYLVSVTNNGPGPASNVVVNDALPAGLAYLSSTASQGSFSGSSWTVGTLANGQRADLAMDCLVQSAGVLTNTASVTATSTDPTPGNNSSSVTVTALPSADLEVTKTVPTGPGPYAIGGSVPFTITVTNHGPSDATGVTVTDTLPAGLTLDLATPACAYNDLTNTCTWTIANLASGVTATLTLVTTANQEGTLSNAVIAASSTTYDPTPGNNTAIASVSVDAPPPPQADLSVTKTVDNATPYAGNTVTYTITAANNGPSDATGVTVTDTLPAGLTFVSATPSVGTWAAPTWTIGSLANGGSATLTITAQVNGSAVPEMPLQNTATIGGAETDPHLADNTAAVSITPHAVTDLALTKTALPGPYDLGTNVTFTLTATNNGPSDATGVTVTDTLPAGLTFVSATPSVGTWAAPTWTIGSLANGGSATLTITARVTATGSFTNTAAISGSEVDPDSSNNTASSTISGTAADLAVTKTVTPGTAYVGDTVHYLVSVTNNGPGPASTVVVEDLLPAGLAYLSSTASQGSFSGSSWTVGTLANGQRADLSMDCLVQSAGVLTNTASVTATSTDPTPGNNSSSATVTALPSADLEVTKTGSVAPGTDGQEVATFVVTVINHGPSTATAVTVADMTPAGLSLVPQDPFPGAWSSPTWTIGDMADGATATLTLTGIVTATGTFTNTATVTGTTHDPNMENNTAVASVQFVAQPSLTLTKSCAQHAVNPGASCPFTLHMQNNGNIPLTIVHLDDDLPEGFTFDAGTPPVVTLVNAIPPTASDPTVTPGTAEEVSWGTWTINPGGSIDITFTTLVAASAAPGVYRNHVTAYSTELPPITEYAEVEIAGITLTKAVGTTGPVAAGNALSYTLTYTYWGNGPLPSLTITDTLDAALDASTLSIGQGGTYSAGTRTITWAIGPVADGGSGTVTFSVNSLATIVASTTITNTGSYTAGSWSGISNTVQTTISPLLHTIVASAGAGGTISPSGSVSVSHGGSQTFVISASPGYAIASVLVDGVSVGAVAGYSFTGVVADHTIVALFTPVIVPDPVPITHIITASAGPGGTITPAGMVTVNDGATQSFAIMPATGYHIADVMVDGVSVGAVTSYTFANVRRDHTIVASFTRDLPEIHLQKTVSPTGAVLPGDTLTYTLSYRNTGMGATSLLTITDVLDASLDPSSLTIGQGGAYNASTRTIQWNLGTVTAGGTGTVTFSAKVLATVATSTVLRNTGTCTDDTGAKTTSNTVETPVTPVVVYHHNFFVGYPDKLFKPERNVSRAEIAAALARALGLGWSTGNPGFPDVPATHWAIGDIQLMKDEGIMVGDTGGTFRPDAPITRAEAAAVFLRLLGIAPATDLSSMPFNDVKSAFWAAGDIEAARQQGILTGYPDGTFHPTDSLTRAEFAIMACKALGREPMDSNERLNTQVVVQFPDVSSTFWAYSYIMEVSTPHTVTNPTRLSRTIKLKDKTIPLYTEGQQGIITFRKVGDVLFAIVPVDGLQSVGNPPQLVDPAARTVTVRIIARERP